MKFLNNTLLILCLLSIVGCTGQVKGPVTGSRYKIDVGCTEDMQRYREEREQVVGKDKEKLKAEDIKIECPTGEAVDQ